ncbi:MAG: ABC transporter permease [Actinomycetota bacterium]
METLLQDIRYGLRKMLKSPGFTAVAVLTMALGIGVNAAIFSIVDALLLHSLPYPDADRLVKISFNNPGVGLHDITFSYPEFDDLRTRADVFDQVSVVWPGAGNLTGAKEPERLELLAVSPNYFSMLGVVPQLGRIFGDQDSAPGFAPVAVISDGLWRRAFASDPGVLGRTLQIDNDPYTIVGVLPPGFRHPGRTLAGNVEVWLTAGFKADPFSPNRRQREIQGALGRLKPGLDLKQAQANLDKLAAAVRADYPNEYPARAKWDIELQPLQESLVGNVRPMLLVLLVAVFLIVLIASVNIASLLLARASERQRELGVRLALGASPNRMLRQMLTESVVLSLFAGMLGVLTTMLLLKPALRFLPFKLPRINEVGVNWTVLLFALIISVLTGILFGLAPAIQSIRGDLFARIREGAEGSGYSTGTSRLRGFLIISEMALAVILMIGSGLLLRTFLGLINSNPGFVASKVVAASLWLPAPNDPKTDKYGSLPLQVTFLRDVLHNLSTIPGVEMAAITSALPASNVPTSSAYVSVEGRPDESSSDLRAEVIRVTPDFFKVMETPLMKGRFFTESDEPGKPIVAILDETTARLYWHNEDPIDKQIRIGPRAAQRTMVVNVVGLIKDIKHDGLDKDGVPHIYISAYQRPGKVLNVVLHTSLPASALEPEIRRQIQRVDPALPVFGVRGMEAVINASLAPRRFSAELVGAFAVLAMILACIGIYGLLAYMVGQRSHEIGIRMALGARRGHIFKQFLIGGCVLAGSGIVIGLIIGVLAASMIASLLYGVHPVDPLVFLVVPSILLVVAVLASFIPALRAARLDPITTLREP